MLKKSDKSFRIDLGARIRKHREELSQHTQESIAETIGVHSITINRIETGKTELGMRTAFKLAREFKISLDELTGYSIDETDIRKELAEPASKYNIGKAVNITFQIGGCDRNSPAAENLIHKLGEILINFSEHQHFLDKSTEDD